jgi:hypothetical protein
MRRIADRTAVAAILLACWAALVCADESRPPAAASKPASSATPAKGSKVAADRSAQELFRGKVVMLRDALARRKIDATEEIDKQVVLETPTGDLIPIVPDWRGRAFYQDARLRDREVELVGKRQRGVPYLQVLMVFTFDKQGQRQYTDYYCDTCAFPMYEIKPCECCQGPVRLRFQPRDLPDYIKARLSNSVPVGKK